jgi:hypothetical protein
MVRSSVIGAAMGYLNSPAITKMSATVEHDNSQRIYLHLTGDFVFGDSSQVISLIEANHPQYVLFNSNGGSIGDAIKIGRFIRSQKINTVANENACASACFLAFIGGEQRFAFGNANIGVHQSSFPLLISFQTAAEHIKILKDYVAEMGVMPAIIDLALASPPDAMHYLKQEFRDYNVATVIVPKNN